MNLLDWYNNKFGGALVPPDYNHVDKYPAEGKIPITPIPQPTSTVGRLDLFKPPDFIDQGRTNACCAAACCRMMMMLRHQVYNWQWLYQQAQKIDTIKGENDKGTTLRACFDVMRDKGLMVQGNKASIPSMGIVRNRWITNTQTAKEAILAGLPIVMCIDWYSSFDKPVKKPDGRYWFATPNGSWGNIRFRHCVTLVEVDENIGAFGAVNSWGKRWPYSYIPYAGWDKVMFHNPAQSGECAVVTIQ